MSFVQIEESIAATEQLQDFQEEVDDVKVQVDRCPNILIQVILLDEHPGVVYNVAAEEESPEQCKDGAASTTKRTQHTKISP